MAVTAVVAVGGPAMARSLLVAGATVISDGALASNNPLDDMTKAEIWRRYQLEFTRRKLS